MFKLFNATKKVANRIASSFEPAKDVIEVIAEIHNEFDGATERLLNEARNIIENGDKDKIKKAERLKSIGFGNTATVRETQKQAETEKQAKEIADLIMYFNQWYPNNKFITEKEVEKICKKYGLLFGTASRYIGEIPNKNLTEIEAFILRDEDKETRTNFDDYRDSQMRSFMMQSQMNQIASFSGRFSPLSFPQQMPSYDDMPREIKSYTRKPEFKICAPVKDFDSSGMEIKDGFRLAFIPDPIVLQPVKGGYLIVSKWGLEGNDESLTNEKMN